MEAAMEVASNLLPDDRREIEEGHGVDPIEALTIAAHRSSYVYFTMPNGKTAGLAGVDDDGLIWMVCTPVILEYPHAFARGAKKFVQSRNEPLLWNIADKRNKVHLKLLKFLGFKFSEEIFYGPNQLTFIKFYYGNWISKRIHVCSSRNSKLG